MKVYIVRVHRAITKWETHLAKNLLSTGVFSNEESAVKFFDEQVAHYRKVDGKEVLREEFSKGESYALVYNSADGKIQTDISIELFVLPVQE